MSAPVGGTPRRAVVAVVLAGGRGSRAGLDVPKQFAQIGGVSMLSMTISAFDGSGLVDELVVVAPAAFVDEVRTELEDSGLTCPLTVLAGGAERHESSRIAVAHLGERDVDVLIHDAARPFVTREVIAACVEALETEFAVEPVLPSVDSLVRIRDGRVEAALDRAEVHRVQTPQGFRLSVLREAFALARDDDAARHTDDVGVVLRHLPEVAVVAVPGDEVNIKVTSANDLDFARRVAAERLES